MMKVALWFAAVTLAFSPSESAWFPSCHPVVPQTWCVDLSNGAPEKPPSWAKWLSYANKPGCCADQGMLELTPPSWAKSLRIEESANEATGWNINLGDSRTNNGAGGDGNTEIYDAELEIRGGYFRVYKNDVCRSGIIEESRRTVGDTRTSSITVEKEAVKFESAPSGLSYTTTCNRCVFDWSKLWLGMNRVVGGSYRYGTGVCKVCVRFSPYSIFPRCATKSLLDFLGEDIP